VGLITGVGVWGFSAGAWGDGCNEPFMGWGLWLQLANVAT
jgi:hypothetical protein